MSEDTIVYLAGQLATALVIAGIIWNRMGNVETAINSLSKKVDQQNGRINRLEDWRARREGYEQGRADEARIHHEQDHEEHQH